MAGSWEFDFFGGVMMLAENAILVPPIIPVPEGVMESRDH